MRQRIVLTRPGGLVSIVHPAEEAIAWMGCGGYWGDRPHGFAETQIERQIVAGHEAQSVCRFVRAMTLGGCTTAEALAIIRDRDCAHRGTGIELWDCDAVPSDRWFRDAWRRQAHGGAIWVDLDAARIVQQRRAVAAVEGWNARQKASPELWGGNGPHLIDADYRWLKRSAESARSLEELRTVWPADLPKNCDQG